MKRRICTIILGFWMLASCSSTPTISFSETNELGNSLFNYLNYSHTTSQGDWLFYSDYEEDSAIYAQKKNSKKKQLLISDVKPFSPISIVRNEIFYIFDQQIMKYDIETKEAVPVTDVSERMHYFIVVSDMIYYTELIDDESNTHSIYAITTEGKNKELIASDVNSTMFGYDAEKIYYVNMDYEFVGLSLIDKQPIILKDQVNPILNMASGHIYLYSHKGKLESYDIENDSWSVVLEYDNFINKLFLDEDTILYWSFDENHPIREADNITYQYSISEKERKIIDLDIYKVNYVNVIDGVHYYYDGFSPDIDGATRKSF